MELNSITDQDLVKMKELIEYWGNNCGGCETCTMAFGMKTQPEFDLLFLHELVSELMERRRLALIEESGL